MITITIGNSYSKIEGLTTGIFSRLKKVLSYQDNPQAAYFSGFGARPKYLIDNKGNFPTGLFKRVMKFVAENNLIHTLDIFDTRAIPKSTSGMLRPMWIGEHYPAQLEAVEAAIIAGRGCISMPTGSGKSRVIALIASKLNVKTLVVVPNLEIKSQLTTSLNDIFGVRLANNIVVENIDSASLKTPAGFDCLIIDEAHHIAAKTYQKLNRTAWKDICYRFFLTATPFRNDKEETLLFEGIAGDVIYQLSYKRAIKEGYIVPVEAYYIDLPKQQTDAYTWAEVYRDLVVNNYERNSIIAKLAGALGNKSTLILVKEIAHGEILSAIGGIPFVNGQDEASREYIKFFNYEDEKVLIGTAGIIGEGVDTKPCEYVIIAGLGKAKSAFMQQVGRAVRTYPGKESAKVILFRDPSHKFTLRHFREQVKILKEEYGVTPIKIEL